MRKAEAEYFIQQALNGPTGVGFTQHFWDQAKKLQRDLSKVEVYSALQRGKVFGSPIRENEYLCHKAKVRATLPDFGLLEIVVAITVHESVVCITIYEID